MLRFFASLAALSILTLAASARADPPQQEARQPVFDVGLRGGILATPALFAGVGSIGEIEAHWHVFPWLRVGAYGAYVHGESGSSDHLAEYGEEFTAMRFGASTELHARPRGIVDPWLGVGFGGFVATYESAPVAHGGPGLDVSADLGVDLHIGRMFTVGVVWMLVAPVANQAAFDFEHAGGGLYFTGVAVVPLPALRLNVAL
jgi:hypothetical protein